MENSSDRCLRAQGKQRSAGGRVRPHEGVISEQGRD